MKRFILFFACLTSISLVAAQEVLNWKDNEIVSPVISTDNTLKQSPLRTSFECHAIMR